MPTAKDKINPVIGPFQGLFYDRPAVAVPQQGFVDCNNVRCFNGKVTSYYMGWTQLGTFQLNGPVTLIDVFKQNIGTVFLMFGTPTDLYYYNSGSPVFLTPIYNTGTVTVTAGHAAVTGSSTLWITNGLDGSGSVPVLAGDQIYIGSATQQSPSAAWYTIGSGTTNTALTLTTNYTGTSTASAPYTIRHLFHGNSGSFMWDAETYPHAPPNSTDLWFATNGIDFPVSWDGSASACVIQANLGFAACSTLFRFKNLMIYGNITDSSGDYRPYSFANSDNGSPTSMSGGVAFQGIITDNEYAIQSFMTLGDVMMVYTNYDVIAATFVGTPTIWAFREVIRNRGPLNGNLVGVFPDHHRFLAIDGEYYYNGYFTQPIGTQIWRSVLQGYDNSRPYNALSLQNQQYGDMIWALPLISDLGPFPQLSTAFVEHYGEQGPNYFFKPYTKRDFPFTAVMDRHTLGWPQTVGGGTWNTDSQAWYLDNTPWIEDSAAGGFPVSLVGDVNGYIYQLYTNNTASSASSYVTFPPRTVTNERARSVVKRVYPGIDALQTATQAITVILNLYDSAGAADAGTPTLTDAQQFDPTYGSNAVAGPRFTSHFRAGRLAQVKIISAGQSQPWSLSGYDWDTTAGGVR